MFVNTLIYRRLFSPQFRRNHPIPVICLGQDALDGRIFHVKAVTKPVYDPFVAVNQLWIADLIDRHADGLVEDQLF